MVYRDRLEALVGVTGHELAHLQQYQEGGNRLINEKGARWEEVRVLEAFRADRENLLAEWSKGKPIECVRRKAKPVESAADRALKAEVMLEKWQRRLKLAQTKVKTYRRKVRYYERSLKPAATTPQK
jgi:hypothetical protein